MKNLIISSLCVTLSCGMMIAQSKKKKDINAIKSMCGCFEVTFNFAETFSYSDNEDYVPSKTKISHGLEWTTLLQDENDLLSIQHILIVGNPSEPHIVKHWRQDWLYENTNFYQYDHDNQWRFVSKPKADVNGQWTQKVYQVDDGPRYEGAATWVHVDGKSYWENTTAAPLPRREYTTRNDYNVTLRENRHEITPSGWIHDQDNQKIIRKSGEEDVLLAKEKGLNVYKKVDDSRCKAASEWWAANHDKWDTVREKWNTVFAQKQDLELKPSLEDKSLFKHLSDASNNANEIGSLIDTFVVQE